MKEIAPELALHEPMIALTDGADGLSAYQLIAARAHEYLTEGGRVMVEIGWKQAPEVAVLFFEAGWAQIGKLPDLDGRDRVIYAQNPA